MTHLPLDCLLEIASYVGSHRRFCCVCSRWRDLSHQKWVWLHARHSSHFREFVAALSQFPENLHRVTVIIGDGWSDDEEFLDDAWGTFLDDLSCQSCHIHRLALPSYAVPSKITADTVLTLLKAMQDQSCLVALEELDLPLCKCVDVSETFGKAVGLLRPFAASLRQFRVVSWSLNEARRFPAPGIEGGD